MIFSTFVVVISFFLEGLCSKYIPMNSMVFESLFTVISLIIIYPYFHNHENRYFSLAFLIGFVYDVTYTNTLLFNSIIFVVIAIIIEKMNRLISNNSVNVAIISFIIIVIYRIIIYLILCLVNYLNFNIKDLLYSIASSLVLNMIYSIVLYLITDYISKKKRISKID